MEAKIPAEMEMIAPERGKSRGGTRGGKPNVAAADSGLGGGMGGSFAPNLDREIERCDGSEATTQALLGEVITRPKLTEKLLSKPPFRFLHDIVMEVIRSSGFASNLYTPEETDSANVADKTQKILFLEKIIKVVGLQLNTLVVANPSKIVAGRDPQDTNNFLQLLAVAVRHLPDSSAAVRTVLEGLDGGGGGGGGEAPVSVQKASASHAPVDDDMHSPPARQVIEGNKLFLKITDSSSCDFTALLITVFTFLYFVLLCVATFSAAARERNLSAGFFVQHQEQRHDAG